MSYKDDKKWSDRFMPEIKQIVGQYLIMETPDKEDMEQAVDLCTIELKAIRLAVRMRRYKAKNYPDQFTLRMSRPSGIKTEVPKIIEGHGDYYFYGICDNLERSIIRWYIADLKVFRLWFMQECWSHGSKGRWNHVKMNDCSFLSMDINDLPPEFIIAEKQLNMTGGDTSLLFHHDKNLHTYSPPVPFMRAK